MKVKVRSCIMEQYNNSQMNFAYNGCCLVYLYGGVAIDVLGIHLC